MFESSNKFWVNLSNPIDQPACGGAPYLKESLYDSKSFGFRPFMINLFSINSGTWILWPPEEISTPL